MEKSKNYILDTHKGYDFNVDYNQVFYNKWTAPLNHKQAIMLKLDGTVTDKHMLIIKFLFQFTFGTVEMLGRLINEKNLDKLKEELDKLVDAKLLNRFILALDYNNNFEPDALNIYCLDQGGKSLLIHYSNEDTTNWETVNNMKSPENITRDLVVGDFYLKLIEVCPSKIIYFKQNPVFRIGRTAIVPSFEMAIEVNNGFTEYYVGQVARSYDYPMYFRDKLERLNSIFTTKAWKKYYHDIEQPPTLLFLGSDDTTIAKMASMIDGTSELANYYLTTDERTSKDLSKSFLSLVKEADSVSLKANYLPEFDKKKE